MSATTEVRLIWAAGAIHGGIVLANIPLPGRLRVRENLAAVPRFLRQIFYVHWLYIVVVVGLFSALCFGFARELAGASSLGRFLNAFMAAFWLSRLLLQWFYYDAQVRRANRVLDALYALSLLALVGILGWSAVHPSL
jgi:hypothetical protein